MKFKKGDLVRHVGEDDYLRFNNPQKIEWISEAHEMYVITPKDGESKGREKIPWHTQRRRKYHFAC